MSLSDDPEYREWRHRRNHSKVTKRISVKRKLNLGTHPYYTPYLRKQKGASVKYKLEERLGDKEERKENNKRYPFATTRAGLMHHEESRHLLLPDGKTRGQAWGIIRHLWLKIRICNSKGDTAGKEDAARQLRREQDNLGIKLTDFEEFGLMGDYLSKEEKEYLRQLSQ